MRCDAAMEELAFVAVALRCGLLLGLRVVVIVARVPVAVTDRAARVVGLVIEGVEERRKLEAADPHDQREQRGNLRARAACARASRSWTVSERASHEPASSEHPPREPVNAGAALRGERLSGDDDLGHEAGRHGGELEAGVRERDREVVLQVIAIEGLVEVDGELLEEEA